MAIQLTDQSFNKDPTLDDSPCEWGVIACLATFVEGFFSFFTSHKTPQSLKWSSNVSLKLILHRFFLFMVGRYSGRNLYSTCIFPVNALQDSLNYIAY